MGAAAIISPDVSSCTNARRFKPKENSSGAMIWFSSSGRGTIGSSSSFMGHSLPRLGRRAANGFDDVGITTATTDVSLHPGKNFVVARDRLFLQQPDQPHDHAG